MYIRVYPSDIVPVKGLGQRGQPIRFKIVEATIELPCDISRARAMSGISPFVLASAIMQKRKHGDEVPVGLELIRERHAVREHGLPMCGAMDARFSKRETGFRLAEETDGIDVLKLNQYLVSRMNSLSRYEG